MLEKKSFDQQTIQGLKTLYDNGKFTVLYGEKNRPTFGNDND